MRTKSFFLSLLVALMLGGPAYAHTGAHVGLSFASGFLHPLGGLDHLLVMFAVGLLAVQLGERAIWLVPSAFVTMMLVGALIGLSGAEIPGVEYAILISIVAIALPVAFALGMPAPLAMAYVGFFALFHGYAHAAELPVEAVALPYMAGFAVATAIIHALGIGAGLVCGQVATLRNAYALRMAGGLIAIAGVGLAVA